MKNAKNYHVALGSIIDALFCSSMTSLSSSSFLLKNRSLLNAPVLYIAIAIIATITHTITIPTITGQVALSALEAPALLDSKFVIPLAVEPSMGSKIKLVYLS